ncbi:hypothetical protein ACN28S_61800 [Cystobacter fuscus]
MFNRGPGPIRSVLDAIGEYRTHSMLSHGPGAGVTHATMATPKQTDWPGVCAKPMNGQQLQYGYPGLEQINQGGIYNYMYTDDGTEWAGWQQGDPPRPPSSATPSGTTTPTSVTCPTWIRAGHRPAPAPWAARQLLPLPIPGPAGLQPGAG